MQGHDERRSFNLISVTAISGARFDASGSGLARARIRSLEIKETATEMRIEMPADVVKVEIQAQGYVAYGKTIEALKRHEWSPRNNLSMTN